MARIYSFALVLEKVRIPALSIALLVVFAGSGALAGRFPAAPDPCPCVVPNTAEAFRQGRGSLLLVPAFLDADLPWVKAGLHDADCKQGLEFVWVCCALTDDHLHAQKALADADQCQAKQQLTKDLVSYELGRINSSRLLSAAHGDTEQIRARYFMAIDELLKNNNKDAVANLQVIQGLPESEIDEYALANTLLSQLKK